MVNIILTDDHHIVREGMKFFLSTTDDINVVEEFSNGPDTLEYLKKNHQNIDLVLLDLVMPEMNGIEVTRLIKKDYPSVKVLILSSYSSEEYIRPAYQAKADGYIIKEMEAHDLIQAINDCLDGKPVIHKDILNSIDSEKELPHEKNPLSAREMEVLKEIVKGKSNKEIGEALFVSEKTVKTHVSHILSKLEVSDRTKVVIYALKNNMITVE